MAEQGIMDEERKNKILIVDDEVRMCSSLKALLLKEDYIVETACSSREAMEIIPNGGFDLVITDIKMPGHNGIDILQRAKESDQHISVILMTGFASLESAKAAINKGAFDYLTKPLEFDDLLRSIKKGLASRRAEIEKHHLLNLLSSSNKLLEERVHQLNALYKSAGVISGTTNLDILLNQIINLVTGVVGAKSGSITLFDETGKFMKISAAIGLEEDIVKNTRIKIGEGVAGYVAAHRESVIIDNIAEDTRFNSEGRPRYETASAISTPMIHRENLLGVINLNNKEGQEKFTADDLHLLETFASHAAIAIVNAELFEENQIKLKELTILHRIATRLSSSKTESEVFLALFQGIKSIVEADFCYIFTLEDDNISLKITFAEDSNSEMSRALESIQLKLPDEVVNEDNINEKINWINGFFKELYHEKTGKQLEAVIVVPVSVESSLSGILAVGNYNEEPYLETKERLISIIASQTASLYERQRSVINGSKLLTMGKMVSELTHDLKKPLTNIRGTLQVLGTKWENDGAPREFLDSAMQEVDRLTYLVKEMLDFADPGRYKRTERDIIPMIERSLALLDVDIRKSNIQVIKDFTDNPPKILINETEVFETLINLILNAIESMPDGGKLEISIKRVKPENNPTPHLRIGISDEGCGIPREKLNHIFERYYTTKENGTGLGLALVERVLRSHDGNIYVESELNQGTTFYLDFPIN
ncbi:MAG: response regulator [candidate division Zixibacteria bacterium]|nr:response regulator [candidate division Zixibacteria bacterium]